MPKDRIMPAARKDMLVGTLKGFGAVVGTALAVAVAFLAVVGIYRAAVAVPDNWYPYLGFAVPAAIAVASASALVTAWWWTWGDWAEANGMPVPEPTVDTWSEVSRAATLAALASGLFSYVVFSLGQAPSWGGPGGRGESLLLTLLLGCVGVLFSFFYGLSGYGAGREAAGGPEDGALA